MSHAFDARFSPTPLDLPRILARLAPCLDESKIDFTDEITRLHSRDGVPTVLSMATQSASGLQDVARVASSWWGFSLYCVSRPLAEELGRSEAIEVYLRIFEAEGGHMLVCNEASGAFHARAESEALTNDLVAFLMRTSAALEIEVASYAEEDGQARVPTVAELEQRLAAQSRSSRALGWLAVVTSSSLAFPRARALAGPWADRIRISVTGHVVLPFLAGTLDDA